MLSDYLLDRIDASGDCWLWTGPKHTGGYGQVCQIGPLRNVLAHRAVWAALVGDVGDGLELDHLCRVRTCVKPDHLEPVTHQVNAIRGASAKRAACRRGHMLDWVQGWSDGRRRCAECIRQRHRKAAD